MSIRARLFTGASALLLAFGCDSSSGNGDASSSSNDDAVLSQCTYGFTKVNAGAGALGSVCSADADCEFGVCMLPGDPGNIDGEFSNATNTPVNTQFGFCTRGCDCNNDTASRLSDTEKQTLVCYVGPVGSEGKLKYVLPSCKSIADCGKFDSGYTECALPRGSGVFKACLAP